MIAMFANAKRKFAQRELDWRALTGVAYLMDDSYVADLELDVAFQNSSAAILASVPLTNLNTSEAGWCAADAMVFVNLSLLRPCGQAVVADNAQGAPLLLLTFPPFAATPVADTYTLLFAQHGAGWFRL
jgi:hypothetical protein